jgi:hypothetical protein
LARRDSAAVVDSFFLVVAFCHKINLVALQSKNRHTCIKLAVLDVFRDALERGRP